MKASNVYSFDAFCPRLRAGRLIAQGKRIIYETAEPFNQIVLPVEMADLVALSNGRFNMREIIEKIYQRQGYVHFRSIFETVHRLQLEGFLENGNELALNHKLPQSEPYLLENLFLEVPLLKRLSNDFKNPMAFYIFAMSVILAALFSALLVPSSINPLFLAFSEGSFITGSANLLFVFSVLISFKHFVKMFLLMFLTGKVYNLNIVIRPWAIHFKVGDESQFLVQNKIFLVLYHLALVLSPFAMTSLIALFISDVSLSQIFLASVVVVVFQFNPYSLGQLTQFFKNFFELDGNPQLANYFGSASILHMLDPYTSNASQRLRIVFRWLPFSWSLASLLVFSWLIYPHLNFHLILPTQAGLDEYLVGSFVLGVNAFLWNYSLYHFLKSIYFAFFAKPLQMLWTHIVSLKAVIVKTFDHDEVIEKLQELPLFNNLSEAFLRTILSSSDIVKCAKGDRIINEGDESKHLYVLLAGTVDISRMTSEGRMWLSSVYPTSIFGESALMSHENRSADAICTETSLVLRIPASVVKEITSDSQYVRDLESFKAAIIVSQFFSSAPMFRELPVDVSEMLINRSKLDYYSPSEVIFKQGTYGDRFYMILRGSVDVFINETKMKRIKQGGFFGEIAVIAAIPRTATVMTAEPTVLLSIQVDAFWEILVQHIELALFIEYVGEQRFKEGIELFHNETFSVKAS